MPYDMYCGYFKYSGGCVSVWLTSDDEFFALENIVKTFNILYDIEKEDGVCIKNASDINKENAMWQLKSFLNQAGWTISGD